MVLDLSIFSNNFWNGVTLYDFQHIARTYATCDLKTKQKKKLLKDCNHWINQIIWIVSNVTQNWSLILSYSLANYNNIDIRDRLIWIWKTMSHSINKQTKIFKQVVNIIVKVLNYIYFITKEISSKIIQKNPPKISHFSSFLFDNYVTFCFDGNSLFYLIFLT